MTEYRKEIREEMIDLILLDREGSLRNGPQRVICCAELNETEAPGTFQSGRITRRPGPVYLFILDKSLDALKREAVFSDGEVIFMGTLNGEPRKGIIYEDGRLVFE